MSLTQYSQEQLKEMSMVDIAYLILSEKRQAIPFEELMKEVSSLLGLSEEEATERIAQFYTDLNIDGKFICIGENSWGIKSWYPLDQIEEETQPTVKTKKKKAKIAYDEEDLDDYEDLVEDDLDYDDLDDYVDEEELDLDEEDDDFEDEEDDESFDDELIDDDYDVEDDELDADLDLDEEELDEQ
ncbi:DNA-directed RNA polymerase subunit delta [Aeribacillus sp. FSL M8-0254]|uniref:DNA-directed RNA polymerase subunit delta n=1 Tax=Aeribacillus sp. FSL M8-0254 TaxID=2954577 RepID=UPI0030FA1692